MGRVTSVSYECDWCGRPDREDEEATFDDYPKDWEHTNELLCPGCQQIRASAIASAKAGEPARTDDGVSADAHHHYRGINSCAFWGRISRITSHDDRRSLYTAGVLLQEMEERVLAWLKNAEASQRKGSDS